MTAFRSKADIKKFGWHRLVGRAFILWSDKGCEMTRIASLVIKRSIVRDGHKSSVSLENQFWDAFREIAGGKNMTVSDLVATIDHGGNRDNLSSAIRVFVLDHFRRSSEHTPAGSAQSDTAAERTAAPQASGVKRTQ